MLWVPLNMGMSAAHCQGISECLESGHPENESSDVLYLFITVQQFALWQISHRTAVIGSLCVTCDWPLRIY